MSKREKIVLVIKPVRQRNPLALDPLLKKGGVHQKTKGAQRQADKQQLKKSLNDLRGSSAFSLLRLLSVRSN